MQILRTLLPLISYLVELSPRQPGFAKARPSRLSSLPGSGPKVDRCSPASLIQCHPGPSPLPLSEDSDWLRRLHFNMITPAVMHAEPISQWRSDFGSGPPALGIICTKGQGEAFEVPTILSPFANPKSSRNRSCKGCRKHTFSLSPADIAPTSLFHCKRTHFSIAILDTPATLLFSFVDCWTRGLRRFFPFLLSS